MVETVHTRGNQHNISQVVQFDQNHQIINCEKETLKRGRASKTAVTRMPFRIETRHLEHLINRKLLDLFKLRVSQNKWEEVSSAWDEQTLTMSQGFFKLRCSGMFSADGPRRCLLTSIESGTSSLVSGGAFTTITVWSLRPLIFRIS